MKTRFKLSLTGFLFVLVLVACPERPLFAEKADKDDGAVTRGIMHSIFDQVSELLPLSLDEKAFTNPDNRPKIMDLTFKLSKNAEVLKTHFNDKDQSYRFLSKALASDAQEIYAWYSMGKYDEAQFLIHNLTENCISCHSQQKGKRNFPGADKFFANVDIKRLPIVEKAQIQIATRQFDDALKSYETFFASTEYSPAQMALMEAFTDYLKVAIRVKNDLLRPLPVLEKWSKRDGVPEYMKVEIASWIKSLHQIHDQKLLDGDEIVAARKLMKQAQVDSELSLDRTKLVYFIAASSLLLKMTNNRELDPAKFAEAYYLMGICESVIGRSFWVSQTEFFLESAIRTAPGTSTARNSYVLLEEQIVGDYSGSSGTHVPEDVKQLLKDLKRLAYEVPNLKPKARK